ncbi:MAG: DNRLRE domain-containing protein, partial [Myxococcales bacterium]|nr:DNRLRE domain-containing protein [Myxococcales bacterium]
MMLALRGGPVYFVISISAANAATVDLEPAADTMVCEGVAESNGAGTELFVGNTGESANLDTRRALLRWDLADRLPAGSTITAAALTVVVDRTNSAAATTVGIHPLARDWGEGNAFATGGQGRCAVAGAGDATWFSSMHPGAGWTNAGGDFGPNVLSTSGLAGVGTYTFPSTPALVADVQRWLDTPANDFGWILIGDEVPAASAKRFGSREHTTNPPTLAVTFDPGPPGMSAPTPGTAGVQNTVTVSNALPGAGVFLVFGTQAGNTAVPGCPGVSVDIANAQIADSDLADP